MISLYENEKILIIVWKHWFVMLRTLLLFLGILLFPVVVMLFLPYAERFFPPELFRPATNFFLVLYFALLAAFLFHEWIDYFLDTWIITTKRIIDVEQHGLFSREVSEIPLSRVQDITIEVHGIIETLLGFGTIRIQTAGERDFYIHDVPRLQTLKDLIMQSAGAGKMAAADERALAQKPQE
ncbi:MAG: hypothetical protein A2847_01910 [Candidatus Sungbacteria bacterium RIFCSPHIGHO2_01_FULL_50_25]|uniref:YdbS-like PH domain-containing protein n=1 Tax=Candidatus Sungbacteria bacterium RIFCSPHIGHO2_01_FULL_50_25 TaxID=1802265 RepID=A0A1G2K8Y7_9BACT|nr:MAG: hypothetical protein A2847_01910 [Candidatus Sungbacteria bacterium RIFCSPHIGHO2_01_FULL_50_25]